MGSATGNSCLGSGKSVLGWVLQLVNGWIGLWSIRPWRKPISWSRPWWPCGSSAAKKPTTPLMSGWPRPDRLPGPGFEHGAMRSPHQQRRSIHDKGAQGRLCCWSINRRITASCGGREPAESGAVPPAAEPLGPLLSDCHRTDGPPNRRPQCRRKRA